MRCAPEDIEIAEGKAFLKKKPEKYIDITEVIHGYKYPNGNSIGGQVIGRGTFIMKDLTSMDKETGKGDPGPNWTVGAQAVEVEFDTKDYSYRILKAASVIDVGKVINPATAKGVTMGGMQMGLSLASRESFIYNEEGVILNPNLRSYKLLRFGQQPQYMAEFWIVMCVYLHIGCVACYCFPVFRIVLCIYLHRYVYSIDVKLQLFSKYLGKNCFGALPQFNRSDAQIRIAIRRKGNHRPRCSIRRSAGGFPETRHTFCPHFVVHCFDSLAFIPAY